MIYLDTSYIVRLYFEDAGYQEVRQLAASDHVACALHGQAETIAAFHRKFRERAITLKSYRAVLEQFAVDDQAGAFRWLSSGTEIMSRLNEVYAVLPAAIPLRAADAIHLATAAVHGCRTVYSNDTHLLNAAGCFGLKGQDVIGR